MTKVREEIIPYIIEALAEASADMKVMGDYNNMSVIETICQAYERELLIILATSKSKNIVIFEKKPKGSIYIR